LVDFLMPPQTIRATVQITVPRETLPVLGTITIIREINQVIGMGTVGFWSSRWSRRRGMVGVRGGRSIWVAVGQRWVLAVLYRCVEFETWATFHRVFHPIVALPEDGAVPVVGVSRYLVGRVRAKGIRSPLGNRSGEKDESRNCSSADLVLHLEDVNKILPELGERSPLI
jgi:hypothetical protein